ncbi:MAG TPA: response regulator [Candidatus Hydrothermia bacterium]|nr:response regulator [Candidatus Hydrothermae bacterium]MDD3649299.1 response regulator [Candidatus Hydrothermia bacterium]MDD5572626.1 response regulator [Candidatus Hydrothermia bacterium]HOK22714.1 response regulator [Candidatus Hydrothermia bacterium]HOL23423.1 response regulator [Candidatus Hydrothermia bacterium]
MEGYTILLVDDEPDVRAVYGEMLRREGYNVITAESAEDALFKVSSEKIDLMILDIKMRGKSGLEVLETLEKEKKKKNIPVILFTAYSSYQDEYTAWFADAYVVKSGDPTELKNEIKKLIGKNK